MSDNILIMYLKKVANALHNSNGMQRYAKVLEVCEPRFLLILMSNGSLVIARVSIYKVIKLVSG